MNSIIFKKIDFLTLKTYWIEVNHFEDPDKDILDCVSRLGYFRSPIVNPKRISYGLYIDDKLMGGTQLVHWKDDWVRYRTLNIKEECRGKNLGWKLIEYGLKDWPECDILFGWIRDTHFKWAVEHEFKPIDNTWEDSHCGMIKRINNEI